MARIENKNSKGVEPEMLRAFVASHEIDPDLLRADNFDGYLRDRASRLLKLIETATGKGISGRDSEETVEAFGGTLS